MAQKYNRHVRFPHQGETLKEQARKLGLSVNALKAMLKANSEERKGELLRCQERKLKES
jgi:lambda repressor-like predicted transcriptional regulator